MIKSNRWNEHVRIFATFLNVAAVGAFGLSVVAPMIAYYQGGNAGNYSPMSVILWEMLSLSAILKLCAHITLRFLEED